MKTTVSEKGQITIPKNIRHEMSLTAGTVLEISIINGQIVAQKRQKESVKGRWRGKGKLPSNLDVDGYLRSIRDAGE
jgi:AbrB family looped-hinge helix DNA binding protein